MNLWIFYIVRSFNFVELLNLILICTDVPMVLCFFLLFFARIVFSYFDFLPSVGGFTSDISYELVEIYITAEKCLRKIILDFANLWKGQIFISFLYS